MIPILSSYRRKEIFKYIFLTIRFNNFIPKVAPSPVLFAKSKKIAVICMRPWIGHSFTLGLIEIFFFFLREYQITAYLSLKKHSMSIYSHLMTIDRVLVYFFISRRKRKSWEFVLWPFLTIFDLLFLFKGMPKGRCTFPLSSLALTRSGDKGNSVNIGNTITIIFCVFFPLGGVRTFLSG